MPKGELTDGMIERTHAATENKLVRRARLRALLLARQGLNGYQTVDEIARDLQSSIRTTKRDLYDIGAVKVQASLGGVKAQWWLVPAHNPNLPDYKNELTQEQIRNEVMYKLSNHMLSSFVIENEVILQLERSSGPLVADWVSMLAWPEIIHVSEERSAAVIKCLSVEDATAVHAKLVGEELSADL